MARRRRNTQGAFSSVLLLFLGLVLFTNAVASASQSGSPLPPAKVEMICHTDNPAECYPKVFQPTDEFQIVHEDQELPNGLHVRMDIWTGRKEAKINVPDEADPALKGLPVDSGVVVVDPAPGAEEEDVKAPGKVPKGAPQYESYGQVKPPEKESGEFYTNLEYIKKGPGGADLPFDEALEFLEDISHDIYYGEKIAENPDTVQALLCLVVGGSASNSPHGDGTAPPRDRQAASILGSALQNNQRSALEVGKSWDKFMASKCESRTGRGEKLNLIDEFYSSFMPRSPLALEDIPGAVATAKARVAAISGLLKSPVVRDHFLAHGGMDALLETLIPAGEDWVSLQRKVGHLLLDNFVEEEFGATKDLWPPAWAAEKDETRRQTARGAEERWIEVVRTVRERNGRDGEHWSTTVLAHLEEHHGAQVKALPRDEL